jgi:ELAV/HuD family splicing factor
MVIQFTASASFLSPVSLCLLTLVAPVCINLLGTIERVKIVNDKFTGFSLGYGFVKYTSPDAAAAAVTALNGHQIQNKRLKVSVSKPPEREKKTNLYISGLPANWSQGELENLVSPYGKVLEVRVLYDLNTRKCKGVGFARFESQKSAITAINALTGTTVDGGVMPLIVKYADTTNDKVRKAMANGYPPINPAPNNPLQQQNNINPNQQQQFRQLTNNPNQPYYYQSAAPLYNPALQQAAIIAQQSNPINPQQQLNNPAANNSMSSVQAPQGQEFTGICLFVYHLPLEATESTLFQLFGNYGVVTSAKVMRDLLTNRSKGFGFVNLMTEQQAQAAINGLNGFQLGSKYLKVAFKK